MGDNVDYVCECISHDKEKLERKHFEIIEVDSFSLALFWNQFVSAVQAVSNEVTKIGFVCGKRPFPTQADLNSMLGSLQQHYTAMRDLFHVLPEEVGATVYTATRLAVIRIMAALLAVVRSLKDNTEKGAKERLTLTGTLWEACNAVDSIPKNNVLAVLSIVEEETSLAKDAMEELKTRKNENAVEDPSSTAKDGIPFFKGKKTEFSLENLSASNRFRLLNIKKRLLTLNPKQVQKRKYCFYDEDGSKYRFRASKLLQIPFPEGETLSKLIKTDQNPLKSSM